MNGGTALRTQRGAVPLRLKAWNDACRGGLDGLWLTPDRVSLIRRRVLGSAPTYPGAGYSLFMKALMKRVFTGAPLAV
jgi:hypothetical protein